MNSINNFFYKEGDSSEVNFNFDDEIFPFLPKFLQEIVSKFNTKQEKDVALITSIASISGLCINYKSLYDKRIISPNMYLFITSTFGDGKGTLGFMRMLLEPTDSARLLTYNKKMEEWNKAEKKGIEPKQTVLIVPANTTKVQLLKLLADNDGWIVLFETEADTLTTSMRSKFGDYGDVLRCGLQGEPTSFTRSTDRILVKIPNTNIATILSGTHDQIRRLITDYGDGLASRFDFFNIASNPNFKKVLTDEDDSFERWFKHAGNKLHGMYQTLYKHRIDKVHFTWGSLERKREFEQYWNGLKREYYDKWEGRYNGLINRQGLKCAKIAMVLSIIRAYFESDVEIPSKLICTEEDFYISLSIATTLFHNNLRVADMLKQNKNSDFNLQKAKNETIRFQVIQLWDSGIKSYSEIGRLVGKERPTVMRWLAREGRI